MAQTDPYHSAPAVLDCFREWGVERGLRQILASIDQTVDLLQKARMRIVVGWILGERGEFDLARQQLEQLPEQPILRAWAQACHAFILIRQRKLSEARTHLEQAGEIVRSEESVSEVLSGTLAHCRGMLCYHEAGSRSDESITHFYTALASIGNDHFATGRILDSIGSFFAQRRLFGLALEFYRWALECKETFGDDYGRAVSHGQIGRLHLEWRQLQEAECHFLEDLRISEKQHDDYGVARMHNELGRVELGRRNYSVALAYLDRSVSLHEGHKQWEIGLAFALKDRALTRLYLIPSQIQEAEVDLREATRIFEAIPYAYGLASIGVVWGIFHRVVAELSVSEDRLREAANRFSQLSLPMEAAQALLERARTQRQARQASVFIRNTLLRSLLEAEKSRLDPLVEEIEKELLEVAPDAYWERFYRRARGREIPDSMLQVSTTAEAATILFLDIESYSTFVQAIDSQIVLGTLNQLFWYLSDRLNRHNVIVNQHLGDGFMAFARGEGHEIRAVRAGLELLAVVATQLNPLRKILEKPILKIRIGIATGHVTFGNVGTYSKMDFTAVGETTNLAARLQSECRENTVCVSEQTFERVKAEVRVLDLSGRSVSPKNFPPQQVWDIVGLRGE